MNRATPPKIGLDRSTIGWEEHGRTLGASTAMGRRKVSSRRFE
jgi:hypothetical protein